jgi:hypothetical protein
VFWTKYSFGSAQTDRTVREKITRAAVADVGDVKQLILTISLLQRPFIKGKSKE